MFPELLGGIADLGRELWDLLKPWEEGDPSKEDTPACIRSFISLLISFFILREHASRGGEREGGWGWGNPKQAATTSGEPQTGLKPTNGEITT